MKTIETFVDYVVRKDGLRYLMDLDGVAERGFDLQAAKRYIRPKHASVFPCGGKFEIFKRIITITTKIEIEEYDGEYYC